jgi:hypothetical protein
MSGVAFIEPLNLHTRWYVPFTIFMWLSLCLHLLHLRYDFICAIEDPTRGRPTGRALRRLCKSLDCARRTEVVAASSDDRVCKGMAANETSKWKAIVRISVRCIFCLFLRVGGQLIQLPAGEVYRRG